MSDTREPVYLLRLTEANHDENEFFQLGGAGFLSEADRQASIARIQDGLDLSEHDCADPDVHACYLIDVLDQDGIFSNDEFEIDEETAHMVLGVDDFEPLREKERRLFAAVQAEVSR